MLSVGKNVLLGQEQERKYIATQGPNMKTISDFWRMIWQYNCQCIVMVTSLFEHARTWDCPDRVLNSETKECACHRKCP
ncbi:Receptor-type tyrosine-protein phosphatase T [Taenia solium]|eukprot:TsM_000356600 transcript=TsM_000356600 gene=TsM_000356600